jgi:AcrR family transcriptional regulator
LNWSVVVGIEDRKGRQKADREIRIIMAAQKIAESEGWEAVTIRRLANEIEYSQPVLYSHFANRDDIVAAVAVEGFKELGAALAAEMNQTAEPREILVKLARAYLDFATNRPALYAAMFVLSTGLRFAEADTRKELQDAFGVLSGAAAPFCKDADLAAETFWAALHGLAELERSGRIRAGIQDKRIHLVVDAITGKKR